MKINLQNFYKFVEEKEKGFLNNRENNYFASIHYILMMRDKRIESIEINNNNNVIIRLDCEFQTDYYGGIIDLTTDFILNELDLGFQNIALKFV